MKKSFVYPIMEFLIFNEVDIITTSAVTPSGKTAVEVMEETMSSQNVAKIEKIQLK